MVKKLVGEEGKVSKEDLWGVRDLSYTIKKNSNIFFAIENHFSFINKWPYLKQGDPFYNYNLGWNYSIAKPT